MRRRARDERGSAVVDFCLVAVVLLPLVLALVQLALVLHVRATMTAAASEGARAAAVSGGTSDVATERAREVVTTAVGPRYARDIEVSDTDLGGHPGIEVTVRGSVPPLGLLGPGIDLEVTGTAVREVLP